MLLVHATSVEIDGHAVLLRAPSGGGKSDLALRLIDAGAVLVADDQTALTAQDGRLFASCPDTIAGLFEVRGLGVVRLPHCPRAPLSLVVDLVAPDQVERHPEPATASFLGIPVPSVALAPFEASAASKVRLAMRGALRDIMVR
ncbi:MAG: HPr kinase/phosphatase C-terminal domain-containing protein [Alphaproteobacteria bacterium]|nr:HPr kinase/phosphatase C-terminal domain-containing protein [Alphaproteobacteria bacterium]